MITNILYAVVCVLIGIIIYLAAKLSNKTHLDITEKENFIEQVNALREDRDNLQNTIDNQQSKIQENYEKLNDQAAELDDFYEIERNKRLQKIDDELVDKKKIMEFELQQITSNLQAQENLLQNTYQELVNTYSEKTKQLEENFQNQETLFNSLIEPIQLYDKEQQAKLFYTIQIPEEYHSDIDYLLNTVSQKIQHPDVINKLIWTEYIKTYMDDTIKRVGIKEDPGIYKITNIKNGKAYIGKSTNVKKRLQDHIKSSIGISTIAHQAVHTAILEDGIWNWTFEVITYCDKDKLSELEKYYINFFKTQEYGYNKREGG